MSKFARVISIGRCQFPLFPDCSVPFFKHIFSFTFFSTILSQWDFSHRKFGLPSLGKASCDRVALPNLRCTLGCFSVSIIHRTLTMATGFLTCTLMQMHPIVHKGITDTVRESALKIDSRRKIPCRTGESNLR